jgi:release factor glutamine methyltransferase
LNSGTQDSDWTIKRLLDWTSGFFKSKGLDSARLGAEILLSEALRCQRIELYTRFAEVPDDDVLATYRDWVKRHAAGEPVAYLVGSKEFYSLKFEVDSRVLIPRPETEHVVIAAIDAVKSMDRETVAIVDVGTGSGCIAITLATQLPQARFFATDVSASAIELASSNAARHQMESRIEFVVGDLLAPVPTDFQPDLIVSNPPYIGLQEKDTVDKSVREYEPATALFGGVDGTEVIVRLIRESADRLSPNGYLIFETSPIIADHCRQLVAGEPEFAEPKILKDLAGHQRVIMVRKQG